MISQTIITTQLTAEQLADYIKNSIETAVNFALAKFLSKPEPSSEKYLTINEVAKLLNVSLPTIWAWRKEGKLPFKRIGRRVLFSKTDVEKSLKNIDLKEIKGGVL